MNKFDKKLLVEKLLIFIVVNTDLTIDSRDYRDFIIELLDEFKLVIPTIQYPQLIPGLVECVEKVKKYVIDTHDELDVYGQYGAKVLNLAVKTVLIRNKEEQRKHLMDLNRKMQVKYHVGLVLGIVAAIAMTNGLCK